MENWNGKKINFAKSKGGVIVVTHPSDNLISANCIPWPPPEIIQKLYQSRQVRAFEGVQFSICTSGLGYYCDLQSLHSEDAITWSVFGTVAYSSLSIRENWVSQFFKLLDIPNAVSTNAVIFLWRRIPHPDTLVSGGPELDFGIITDNTLILGEAKWQSGVGSTQGKKKNKDQIQLRGEFLKKYGRLLFPSLKVQIVVGVGLFKNTFNNMVPTGVSFLSTTWEDICSIQAHPHFNEIQRYYKWKLDHI
ncbi:MAG: hypothetical protein MUP69_09140 [Candidatus Atribacteria bacterium]|nr:hypothetical protein [Candidatus Atribacteria bacterium]